MCKVPCELNQHVIILFTNSLCQLLLKTFYYRSFRRLVFVCLINLHINAIESILILSKMVD